MKKKVLLSLFLGVLLSIGGFYLAFRNVPARDILQYLSRIDYIWVLPSFALILLSFILRVVRWMVILAPFKKIDFWSGFHPLMIAFTINCILPGRAGELARPAILYKKNQVRYSTGLATVAMERVFDMVLIIGLFLMVYPWLDFDASLQLTIGGTVLSQETLNAIVLGMFQLGILLILGMIVVSLEWSRMLIKRVMFKMPTLLFFTGKPFREKVFRLVCSPLVKMIDHIATGFALIRSPARILACLGLSIMIWVIAALSYYVFSLGCPGIEITFFEMVAVMVIICLFIAMPSVPGYWGLWEAGGIFAMMVFGIARKEAAGFTLANHAMQVIPVILIGFGSALVTGVNLWKTSFESR